MINTYAMKALRSNLRIVIEFITQLEIRKKVIIYVYYGIDRQVTESCPVLLELLLCRLSVSTKYTYCL